MALKIRNKKVLIYIIIISSIFVVEGALRLFMPRLGSDIFLAANHCPGIQFGDNIGYYEPRPCANISSWEKKGFPVTEMLNSEGFRGPEYSLPKPKDRFRILAIGDSIAQGLSVTYDKTWEKLLEDNLHSHTFNAGSNLNYEVINAGVGGYVSWQAASRLESRGLKYEPDIILVLVGWNDIVYSSVPGWKPKDGLIEFIQLRKEKYESSIPNKESLFSKIRMPLYRTSYIACLIREIRYKILGELHIRKEIARHRVDSGLRFNEEALGLYIDSLKSIYNTAKANNIQMGLITLPTIMSSELLDDYDINHRLFLIYDSSPLSIYELWGWYKRYTDAQREFAASHPDVILIDVADALKKRSKKDRLLMFMDMVHLSEYGNREFADTIFNRMKEKGVI